MLNIGSGAAWATWTIEIGLGESTMSKCWETSPGYLVSYWEALWIWSSSKPQWESPWAT